MEKELLFYTGIYNFTVEEFINKLNEIPKDEPITVRLNSPGGSVFAGWGMIAALNERTGKKTLKVDGNASSMAFMAVPFFDYVEALDVTSFMVHRAEGYVNNDDDQKMLDNANNSLREKIEKRISKRKFKEVTGVSIKEIFESDERRNVWLTAKQAKEIGLVDKVVRLNPKEVTAMRNNLVAFSSFDNEDVIENLQGSKKEEKETTNIITKKIIKMTKLELKASHPELYNEIYNEGVSAEFDRQGAYLAFAKIDLEAVKAGIASKNPCTQTFMSEMTMKAISSKTLEAIKDESPNVIEKPKEVEAKSKEEIDKQSNLVEAMKAAGVDYEPSKN